MTFNWHVDISTLLAIASLIITQLYMHKKNIESLKAIKIRLGLLWAAYLHDHGLPDGKDDF